MHKNLIKLLQLLCISFCIFFSACSTQITVESNSTTSINTLPKNTVIRVVLASSLKNLSPFNNTLQWQYIARAKLLTEQQLERLGFTIVDKGLVPSNNGKPTLIAIVDSTAVEQEYQISEYRMTLLEPLTKNNPILNCDTNAENSYLCIAPQNTQNTKILYQANCLYQGAYNAPATVVNYCILSTLKNFPHSIHNKIIYKNNREINSTPIQPSP